MTARHSIIIVHLRQPRRRKASESRSDPFFEFGSFGCTGCHRRNLMNPRRAYELEGARLAFAQGGRGEFRLVLLTPPIRIRHHKDRCEAVWKPTTPMKFGVAPLLIDNDGNTDFGGLVSTFSNVDRESFCGRFSSAFRTRRKPLEPKIGTELTRVWNRRINDAITSDFAQTYNQTMPFDPPKIDNDRANTYASLLSPMIDRSTRKCKPVRTTYARKSRGSKGSKTRC